MDVPWLMLKLLKHSVTYVNISLHFSGTSNQESDCWAVWRPKILTKRMLSLKVPTFPIQTKESGCLRQSGEWEVVYVRAHRTNICKGSSGCPGVYQREYVIRIISQVELAPLTCEYAQSTSILTDSQREVCFLVEWCESQAYWRLLLLEVGHAGGREKW